MVTFDRIPTGIQTPGAYLEMDSSQASGGAVTKRALLIGEYANGGGDAAVEDHIYAVPTLAEAERLFSKGSATYDMIERYRQNDPSGELYAAATTPAGGAAATGKITVTGTATANGTIYVYTGDRYYERLAVDVATGDDATAIGLAIELAITAQPHRWMDASNAAGVVTLASLWNGVYSHGRRIAINERGAVGGEVLPSGVSVAITNNMGELSQGSGTYSVANVITSMGDTAYDFIVSMFTDDTNVDLLEAELNDDTGRWAYNRQVYGHLFMARQSTQGELTTYGNARNSQHSTCFGFEGQNDAAGHNYAPKSLTPPWAWAAGVTGQIAVANKASAARPYKTLLAIGNWAPAPGDQFSDVERETLLDDGIATVYYSPSGGVHIQRCITTYQTDAAGNVDDAYKDYTTLSKLTEISRDVDSALSSTYPRAVLTDSVPAGAPTDGTFVDPDMIKGTILGRYKLWVDAGYCRDFDGFKDELIVERDGTDPNRVNIFSPVRLTGSLLVTATRESFRF
jgi:phage tail sheath gpL-like